MVVSAVIVAGLMTLAGGGAGALVGKTVGRIGGAMKRSIRRRFGR
jgi:hypothetical protein